MKTFVEQIDYHLEVDSTNNRGLELVEQGGNNLSAVGADRTSKPGSGSRQQSVVFDRRFR